MESIQDIEAEETAKTEDWETIQNRLLRDIGVVDRFLGRLVATSRGIEYARFGPRLEDARQALNLLKAEIEQLGHETQNEGCKFR